MEEIMRKANSRLVSNLMIVCGIILVILSVFLYFHSHDNSEHISRENYTYTETPKKRVKIDSLSNLKNIFEKIEVGDSDTGDGGTKIKQVEELLGKPDIKGEEYSSGEKEISYTWTNFPWNDPTSSLMVIVRDGKVISKTININRKRNENVSDFPIAFNSLKNGEDYSSKKIVEKLGYPSTKMVLNVVDHDFELYTWSDANTIYSIEIRDGKLKDKRQNEY